MSDLDLELNFCVLVQEHIRVLLFWSSVQPNALNLIPNFDFGEDLNLGPGSLKNSSSVKGPNL